MLHQTNGFNMQIISFNFPLLLKKVFTIEIHATEKENYVLHFLTKKRKKAIKYLPDKFEFYLWINKAQVEIRDASHIWGKGTWEVEEALREELGDILQSQLSQAFPGKQDFLKDQLCLINRIQEVNQLKQHLCLDKF